MVDKAFLQDVRDRLSISSVVGKYIDLKRAGNNFKGVCPFHQEKKPSFMVSDEKQLFHCFGCAAGGDIFTFIMKHQGLSFPESIELLANEAGLPVPKFTDQKEDVWRERLQEVLDESIKFYHQQLAANVGDKALKYLKERKIEIESIKKHFLGFAPFGGESLVKHLKSNKLSFEAALELGLIKKRDNGGYYDFFRSRIMFPIFSPRGKASAFSGRVVSNDQEPKYLNSPESNMFHKATSLYGLDKAAPSIRKSDQVILVEGQLDVISLIQNGLENVVAPLGTALTVAHIHVLFRYTKNIVLVFDGDDAGKKAAWRMLPIFIEEGVMPKSVQLPSDEDPDSYIRNQGRDALLKLIDSSPLLLEFVLDLMLKSTDNKKRLMAIKELSPMVEKCSDSMEKELYKQIIGRKLGISFANVTSAANVKTGSYHDFQLSIASPERLLAKMFIQHPGLYSKYSDSLRGCEIEDLWAKTLFGLLESVKNQGLEKSTHLLDETDDDDLKREIAAISLDTTVCENPEEVISDCFKMFVRRDIEKQIAAIDNKLRQGKTSNLSSEEELEMLSIKQNLEKQRRKIISGEKEG